MTLKETPNIVTKTQNAAGESALGDLIADAQVNDPSVVAGGAEPVVAFMNPGGIRADLTFASSPKAVADDASQTYRIVTNNFLSDGGDGFPAFTSAGNKVFGGLDIDGVAAYLPTVSLYTPAALGRITIQ